MTSTMASGYVRLNGRFFTEDKLKINKHKLSQTEQVSYPTVLKYLVSPGEEPKEEIKNISGDVLYAILVRGMGLTPAEIENMRVGDLFEVVYSNGEGG